MSSPLYEKHSAKHDFIEIDEVEYSNAFKSFRLNSEHSSDDSSGYSVSGVDENVPGTTAQGFEGEYFLSPEVTSAFWALHIAKEPVLIRYQENGLVDPDAPLWYGMCYVNTISAGTDRGSVATSPFSASTADANGIRMINT